MEELLINLIIILNEYNAPDMLDGYLNPIATDFNSELIKLNLPQLTIVEGEVN